MQTQLVECRVFDGCASFEGGGRYKSTRVARTKMASACGREGCRPKVGGSWHGQGLIMFFPGHAKVKSKPENPRWDAEVDWAWWRWPSSVSWHPQVFVYG